MRSQIRTLLIALAAMAAGALASSVVLSLSPTATQAQPIGGTAAGHPAGPGRATTGW